MRIHVGKLYPVCSASLFLPPYPLLPQESEVSWNHGEFRRKSRACTSSSPRKASVLNFSKLYDKPGGKYLVPMGQVCNSVTLIVPHWVGFTNSGIQCWETYRYKSNCSISVNYIRYSGLHLIYALILFISLVLQWGKMRVNFLKTLTYTNKIKLLK